MTKNEAQEYLKALTQKYKEKQEYEVKRLKDQFNIIDDKMKNNTCNNENFSSIDFDIKTLKQTISDSVILDEYEKKEFLGKFILLQFQNDFNYIKNSDFNNEKQSILKKDLDLLGNVINSQQQNNQFYYEIDGALIRKVALEELYLEFGFLDLPDQNKKDNQKQQPKQQQPKKKKEKSKLPKIVELYEQEYSSGDEQKNEQQQKKANFRKQSSTESLEEFKHNNPKFGNK